MAKTIFAKKAAASNGSLFHHSLTEADGTIMVIPPEAHSYYELFYLISGKIHYIIEGKSYDVRPGDLIIANIGDVHTLNIDLSEPYERVVIQFDKTIIPEDIEDAQNIFFPLNDRHLFKKEEIDKTSIPMIISEIIRIFDKEKYLRPLLLAEAIKLLVEINKICDTPVAFEDNYAYSPLVREAMRYINDNVSSKLSLEEIASHIYINKFYLTRLFKRETGMTVNEYVTMKKIYYANGLMLNGIKPSDASVAVGYQNYSTFFYNFRKIFNKSPTAR